MSGKLVFVSGISGSGKTTLIHGALKAIPDLMYLKTTTTRPVRENEESSFEYTFVTDDEYCALKSKSRDWDETEYAGFKYGADVELVKNDLRNGVNVIVAVTPETATIDVMRKIYGIEPVKIWIDTTPEIAAKRVEADIARSSRNEHDTARIAFDFEFKPSGEMGTDVLNFTKLILKILD